MPNREPIKTTNLDIYGSEALPWSRPRELLDSGALSDAGTSFLGTVRPDGRPHAAGVGAAWYDGDLYFQTGPSTQKGRNVAANPACTLAASLPGIDLVFEGDAERVTDAPTLEAVAALYREGGWPVEVEGDAFTAPFSAPSAGPPPWHLFRIAVHTVFGVAGAEPHGATRWRF
jgi:Pyridoxamine 5'-phosphate oxidase